MDIQQLIEDRKANPIKCEVCSEKKGHDVYFTGLDWYHCPRCGQHGLASVGLHPILQKMNEPMCTACANHFTHGWPDPKDGGSITLCCSTQGY